MARADMMFWASMRKSALLVFVGQTVACAAAPRPPPAPETPTHAVFVSAAGAAAEPILSAAVLDPALRDRDGDGASDGQDACPDVPGPKSADAKTSGCPVGPALRGCKLILEEMMSFEPNSAVVKGPTALLAKRMADILKAHQEIALVGIEGFANPRERSPRVVSVQRARALRDTLVAEGIDPARLRVSPKPGEHPPWDCQSCDCVDAAGRVVETIVLQNEDGPTGTKFTTDKAIVKPRGR